MFPPLWLELFGIRAEVLGAAMHDPDRVIYDLAFADQNGRFAVRAAPNWEDGVGYSLAAVEGDDGVEAESCKSSVTWIE